MHGAIEIKPVRTGHEFATAKSLILEYVNWLGIDLSFQNFDRELDTLPVTYGYPDGGLFLALTGDRAVGVAGIKRFNEQGCEVKRMYVQPESRGQNIGKLLLLACIGLAKELNYQNIKLDTADFMKSAIKLYTDHGFVEIPSYRFNPYEQARYFELVIHQPANQ